MKRLVEELSYKIGSLINLHYWDTLTDHEDYDKILKAIDIGGGQTCDIAGVIIELHRAGFKIVKIK